MWTIEKVEALVEDIRAVNPGLQAFSFLNRADLIGSENDEAAAMLAESKGLSMSIALWDTARPSAELF